MTREEIYASCVQKIANTNCLMLEAATGTGKTKVSIDLINYLINSQWYKDAKEIRILILVAKIVHKTTWDEEIAKWGGIHHPTAKITIVKECYDSLHKHCNEYWDIVLADEVHHVRSEARQESLRTVRYGYFIGLSATIPNKLKMQLKYHYHADFVVCDIVEAIEDEILPEPTILLFPLILDNREPTEEWEINAKLGGPIVRGKYADIWKYKKQKVHAILSCTEKQKCMEYDKLVEFFKRNNRKEAKLYMAGKRLEFLADIKVPIIKDILRHLKKERVITFCKSIPQAEAICRWCIHSKNEDNIQTYKDFNAKKINHISAVNILNENANLVDCKYAIFTNLSSSEVSVPQRLGRSLRHKSPVIIVPYYKGTREEELANDMVEGFNKNFIKIIHSISEIE